MRKVSVALVLCGFVFVFFTLPFSGIDLLLDPVGYLLVYNGARGLAALYAPKGKPAGGFRGFTLAQPLCIALVGVTALQLFFAAGTFALVLAILRAVLEIALFCVLAQSFFGLAKTLPYPPKPAKALGAVLAVGFVVCAFAAAAPPLCIALGAGFPAFGPAADGFCFVAHTLLCVLLLPVLFAREAT